MRIVGRMMLVQALQGASLAFAALLATPPALIAAAVFGAGVAIAGTDSGWRRANALLTAQAAAWAAVAALAAGYLMAGGF